MDSRTPTSNVASRTLRSLLVVSVISGAALGTGLLPAAGVSGFGDVGADDFYTDAVQWMVDEEITTGTSPTCFSPNATVSRGQAAALIWRMKGEPKPKVALPFDDVVSEYQLDPVAWMFEAGITTGTSATTFSPDNALTRGEVAAMLWRLAGEPEGAPSHQFVDVVASWQHDAVSWLSQSGITTGTSPTHFSPDVAATRGQLATFLYRYSGEPTITIDDTHPVVNGCDNPAPAPGDGGGDDPAPPPDDPSPPFDNGLDRHSFDQICDYMGSLNDDPIVFPGNSGASHLHDFFGVLADADTDYADLRGDTSATCQSDPANRSSYWTPAALDNRGEPIVPERFSAYYRGKERVEEVPFPIGLRIITDEAYFVEDPLEGAAQLFLGFPDCSNGEADSEDHRSHMAYSTNNDCPPSHPLPVARITFRVTYPVQPVTLSSGAFDTAHADYFSGWSEEGLAERVDRCLNEGRDASAANVEFCS